MCSLPSSSLGILQWGNASQTQPKVRTGDPTRWPSDVIILSLKLFQLLIHKWLRALASPVATNSYLM